MTFNKDRTYSRHITFKFLKAFILLSAALSQAHAASVKDPACSEQDIITLQRPLYPDDPKSTLFPYSAKVVVQNPDPGAFTVLFLPGGPGQSAMKTWKATYGKILPPQMNFILFDPRGSGCNALENEPTSPSQFYTTDNIASDVLAFIQLLKLKNYIIYGTSYGTVWATVLTHQIEHLALDRPKAVILDGVVGPASLSYQVEIEFQKLWGKVK